MNLLGNGLSAANHDEEALSLKETELALMRRLGDSESNILVMQGNLANTYHLLGRLEEALRLRRDVYSATLRLFGEHELSLQPTTTRRPLPMQGVIKKPGHCCAKRFPWRDAFLGRVENSRSG